MDLALDPEYRTAMVGMADCRYLWILSRIPQLDEGTYRRLVEQAAAGLFCVGPHLRSTSSPGGHLRLSPYISSEDRHR